MSGNEIQRLSVLYALNVIDTPAEEHFDCIIRLSQGIFDAPVALITLVDVDRVWFKSCQGVSITEMPRTQFFCGHTTFIDGQALVVPDTRLDERFAATRVMVVTADSALGNSVKDEADPILLKPISFSQLRDLAARLRPPDRLTWLIKEPL